MRAPVPIEQLQMAGESYANWQARLQQIFPPTTGDSQRMAATWRGQVFVTDPTLGGIDVK